jgi:hypothetical protein
MQPHRSSRLSPGAWVLLGMAAASFAASPAAADPVLGFREDWNGASTNGWIGGGASGMALSNPGTDGTLGSGDGYLRLELGTDGSFGSRSSGSAYAGNWIAAGIEQVRVSLNDLGAPDAFEIHFCIGNASNLWQYNAGFSPPNGAWQQFYVDLTNEAAFTRIVGSGTFSQALQFADRILFRNDRAPYVQEPDPAHGDLGLDRVIVTAVVTSASRSTWGRIKQLYR